MARSDVVDSALRRLFARFAHPSGEAGAGRMALVALGGFGRRELLPGSDIDLMILHEEDDRELGERAAGAVLYPLWDLGAGTGHAMRTPQGCRAEAARDLPTLTALLDARLIVGPRTLLASALRRVAHDVKARPAEFVRLLYQSREERLRKFGRLSHSAEPDLKESLGGLRDAHMLGWLSRGLFEDFDMGEGRPGSMPVDDTSAWDRLQEERLMRAAEAEDSRAAWALLLSARAALHRRTRSAANALSEAEQGAVAESLGVGAEHGWEPGDALLRDLRRAARRLEVTVSETLRRTDAAARGRPLQAVALVPESPFPEGAVESFASAAEQGVGLEPTALDQFQEASPGTSLAWSPGTLAAFVRILATGDAGWRALEAADAIGLLEHLLPEWAAVAGRSQHDPYHRYPVDVHLLCAAATAARLISVGGSFTAATELDRGGGREWAVEEIGDPAPLLLGAFLHDVGKVGRGSHVEMGPDLAAGALERMGLDAGLREDVLFLVREHLLLADAATRRNIEDEDLVLRVASRVGDTRRLAMAWLLTEADALATGPAASTPWRLGLVRDLTLRVAFALEHGLTDVHRATRIQRAESAIRAALAGAGGEAEEFIAAIPAAYLLSIPADDAPIDLPLVVPAPSPGEVRTSAARAGRAPDTWRIGVSARDRPGLLSLVAGAFTLAGLTILSAQAFTSAGGLAIDVFEVRGTFESEIGEGRWERFRATLADAVAGRIDLAGRVAALGAHYARPRATVSPAVAVDHEASHFYTVVEVTSIDRPGLLFDLAATFASLDLDVHVAKVSTYEARVVDVFYVTDLAGERITDAGALAKMESEILGAASG